MLLVSESLCLCLFLFLEKTVCKHYVEMLMAVIMIFLDKIFFVFLPKTLIVGTR